MNFTKEQISMFSQYWQKINEFNNGFNNIDFYKKGNKIKIKKQNRGKFTDYCGGNVTDACIQKGKNSSDPKIRKRATFAANAKTWNHKYWVGGRLLKKVPNIITNIRDYFNLKKFIERYGYNEYKMKPSIILSDKNLDRLTNRLVKQHNTFTRGVSVTEARPNYPRDWTDEQIAEHALTHPHVPSLSNSGGNKGRKSVLYTSNSLGLSERYTDGEGYVGVLTRPIIQDKSRSAMLKLNDFRFKRDPDNPISATTDEPLIVSHKRVFGPSAVFGGLAYKKKGKIHRTYSPTKPTFQDAQANAGSTIVSQTNDKDFRHYLFFGEQPVLKLEYMFKHSKTKPSIDFDYHSVGFSKKKQKGGKL